MAVLGQVSLQESGAAEHSSRGPFEVSRDDAVEVLSSTDVFSDTYVGFGGTPSRQACAFRTVLDQSDADRLFKQILAKGHLAGRLYALCGLYYTDHDRFLKEIEPYRRSPDSVATFQGCLMGRQGVARLVELREPRVIRLRDASETTEEWRERNQDPGGSQDYSLDILGGGWPARFKEMKGCHR